MTATTPAGKLVSAFGDVEAMVKLYAPDIRWSLPVSNNFPTACGRDAVEAFNRLVWTHYYRPDCTVTILDEVGDEHRSAARFIYRAHSIAADALYENEYTVFVRSDTRGITEVFEGFDTIFAIEFTTGKPIGSTVAALGVG